ncbi:MAG: M23 family metallopeptidase [Proteobacteria bacterium]|nr:M23 family metallopeptidase [Pseudomonadota bacterium]
MTHEWFTDPGAVLLVWLTSGPSRLSPDSGGPRAAIDRSEFSALKIQPIAGAQSSGYGYRRHPISGRRKFHRGVDFRARRGTPVRAAGSGVVVVAKRRGGYGKLVIISHGKGVETRYAHLHRIGVKKGEVVAAGEVIGAVGSTGRSTGPHLHFEVRRSGKAVDPHWAMRQSRRDVAARAIGAIVAAVDRLAQKR